MIKVLRENMNTAAYIVDPTYGLLAHLRKKTKLLEQKKINLQQYFVKTKGNIKLQIKVVYCVPEINR